VTKPFVLVPCDVKNFADYPFHCVGEKYINAVAHGAQTMPLFLPGLGEGADLLSLTDHYDLDALLDRVDGLFLPGSVSNVHPARYGSETIVGPLDLQRDETVFRLIRKAIERAMPVLAVCRGIQELNVALGGDLIAKVYETDTYFDHREDSSKPREAQYDHAHSISITAGSLLHSIVGKTGIDVNSLHGQGIGKVAADLTVNAVAADGLVEAVSGRDGWVLGVQWHPEWRFDADPNSVLIFQAFGNALRES
jgi:putative glutamine amidotransferase